VDEVLAVVEKEKVDLIMVTRRKRSGLSRFIFGSAVAELKETANCKVRIIDE
jgi:nucleotide-binding universal stress UspA family protein